MSKSTLINDHFQNFKRYNIPKAQLVIADIPYNIGINAFSSNPSWYVGGDNKNGESELAGKEFFDTDKDFRVPELMHFCSTLLNPEPKEVNKAACMLVFCSFEQQFQLIEVAKQYGLNNYISLVFRKNFPAQVLKANMRVVGNCEYGLLLYRDKLPKFNNHEKMVFNCIEWEKDTKSPRGKMVFNYIEWEKDTKSPKIHPTQKPVKLLEFLINTFTDDGDVVIDPCAGSGSTLVACQNMNRRGYGFEIKKDFFNKANKWLDIENKQQSLFTELKRLSQDDFFSDLKENKLEVVKNAG